MNLRNNRTIAFPPDSNPDHERVDPPPLPKKNRSSRVVISAKKSTNAGKKLVRGPTRGSWTMTALESAIESIEDGLFSIRKAGLHYGIPQTTLRNHLFGKSKAKFGSIPKALTIEEEKFLLDWALQLAEEGRAITLEIMKQKVAAMTIHRQTCFKDGLPGKKWWKSFRGRHPEITVRTAQCIELQRVKSMTTKNLENFYSTLRKVYDELSLDPSRVWNCDETGVQAGCRTGMRVIARKGQRNVTEHVPKNREWMTVLVCVNAAGARIPSLYVFKGKRMRDQNLISGCEVGAAMAFQKKAWITDQLFEAWLDHFKSNVPGGVSKERPHLLICDGHGSHVNMATILKAREIGLQIVQLPAHTSHRLQPLDVSCFRPFKNNFRKQRAHFMHSKYGVEPTKEDLATIVSNSLSEALSPSNISAGFLKTGIWPWEPRVQPDPLADNMEKEREAAIARTPIELDDNEDEHALDDAAAAGGAEVDAAADGNQVDSQGDGFAAQADLVAHIPIPYVSANPSAIFAPPAAAISTSAATAISAPPAAAISTSAAAISTSANNPKPKAKRLRLPETLKGRLLVTSDEMVQARLKHQKQCEEAARVRQEQLDEKKKLQAQRKEAKEQERKRREENKKLREEKKAAAAAERAERAALERAAFENQEIVAVRPKRVRRKTQRMMESEAQDVDDGPLIITSELLAEHCMHENNEPPAENVHELPNDENLGCSQGVNLFVDLPLASLEESQDDVVLPCSLEETHLCSWDVHCRKKRRLNEKPPPSPSDSDEESQGKLKALDELYRSEAEQHLQSLGL